ncbi:MAG: transglycosylase SLT domain-containing protein, partial [Sphingobacteriia bacterium]
TVVPLDDTPLVQSYTDVSMRRRRSTVSRLLGRQHVFFPYIEEVLVREGLPVELKYVAVIESALNPKAQSWAAAVGLWQFIHGTARLYHMRMDSYIDERLDPYKATELAVAHFKDLYAIYGDWLLCIAAYNCGPGNVNRAIRLSGGKTSFWEIKRYLPTETAAYVPLFIAATYAMNYATEHNIYPEYEDISYPHTYIKILNTRTTVASIAEAVGMNANELREMNPELKLGIIPKSSEPYQLRVPEWVANKVLDDPIAFYDKIRTHTDPMAYPVNEQALKAALAERKPNRYTPIPPNSSLIYHELKAGETMAAVARRYRVTTEALEDWNQIWGYWPAAGAWLKVYVDPKLEYANPNNPDQNPSSSLYTPPVKTTALVGSQVPPVAQSGYGRTYRPQAAAQPSQASQSPKGTTEQAPTASKAAVSTTEHTASIANTSSVRPVAPSLPVVHVVQAGDTLWRICQRYQQQGLTPNLLASLNGISPETALHVGLRLRLR